VTPPPAFAPLRRGRSLGPDAATSMVSRIGIFRSSTPRTETRLPLIMQLPRSALSGAASVGVIPLPDQTRSSWTTPWRSARVLIGLREGNSLGYLADPRV
jgi:hypothetical protein